MISGCSIPALLMSAKTVKYQSGPAKIRSFH